MIPADLIFLAGAGFQIVVLLPLLLDDQTTIPRETSIPTTIIWFIYIPTYISIGLPLASVATAIGGGLWGLVAIFRARNSDQDIDYITDDLLSGG